MDDWNVPDVVGIRGRRDVSLLLSAGTDETVGGRAQCAEEDDDVDNLDDDTVHDAWSGLGGSRHGKEELVWKAYGRRRRSRSKGKRGGTITHGVLAQVPLVMTRLSSWKGEREL